MRIWRSAPGLIGFCLLLPGCRPADPPPPTEQHRPPMEAPADAGADVRLFLVPDDLRPGDPVCRDQVRTYVADEEWPEARPDAQMRRAGGCVDPELNLYAPEGSFGKDAVGGHDRVYVKVGENRYLRLRP